MQIEFVANIIGMTGVVIVLSVYVMLQTGRISSDSLKFSILNFSGSTLILFSLLFYWNLASVVIEVVWMLTSFWGIVKARKRGKAFSV